MNRLLPLLDQMAQIKVRNQETDAEGESDGEKWVFGYQPRQEGNREQRERKQELGPVEDLDGLGFAEAGAHQALLRNTHLGLALGHHLFEMLDHAAKRGAGLLNGLHERPLLGLRIDDLADALDHRFAIKQQKQAAAQQHEDYDERDNNQHTFVLRNPAKQSC